MSKQDKFTFLTAISVVKVDLERWWVGQSSVPSRFASDHLQQLQLAADRIQNNNAAQG